MCNYSSWLVADMDSTIMAKSKGVYQDLESSPCFPHIVKWLEIGGRLLVVTSDDGYRPFKQFLAQVPQNLRTSVLLSCSDGASLFSVDERGEPLEHLDYWEGRSSAGNG